MISNKYLKNKISYWYGRTGNNLQQLLVGIYLSLLENSSFHSIDHDFFKPIKIKNNSFFSKIKSDIFFFEYESYEEEISTHAPMIIKNYIKPSLKFEKFKKYNFDEETIVIHIRSGDLWRNNGDYNKKYVQNPLEYYLRLIKLFKKAIIVTEIDLKNPILRILNNDFGIPIYSSTIYQDFSILLSAKNLSSSGIGTFSIAAALLSDNLKNFYCSNLYLNEQINPITLKNFTFKIHMLKVDDYINYWINNQENNNILLNHKNLANNFEIQN